MAEKERTPVSVPLACFGLDYRGTNQDCIQCPHQADCQYYLGSRNKRIPLSNAIFQLTPENFGVANDHLDFDDPEIPQMERVYKDCFISVFGRVPPSKDQVQRFAKPIVDAARRSNCSIRMYFLANMVGHRALQKRLLATIDRQQPTRFTAARLVGKIAEERVKTYAHICRKDFGSFAPCTLSAVAKQDLEKDSLFQRMLSSEIEAGYFIADWKISCSGPVHGPLYRDRELALDPAWLATEPSYLEHVINPYLKKKCGSALIQNHRFSAIQTINEFKKNRTLAILAFKTREDIMHQATDEVLKLLGYSALDFEIDDSPVSSSLDYWRWLGLAIQHFNCLQFYDGKSSLLNLNY